MSKIRKTLIRDKDFHRKNFSKFNLSQSQRKNIKKFNHQIEKGEIEYKSDLCLCGHDVFDLVASVDRYGIIQNTVICINCGLIQSNPRMSESGYKYFYESDLYRKIYDDMSLEEYTDLKFNNGSGFNPGKEIYDIVFNRLSSNEIKNILDYGGGGGWNLAPFKAAGMNAIGIEYSTRLVELGKQYGINMVQGGFERLDEIDETYDLIIINHVLEHFINPFDKLKRIMNHLSSCGHIYIALPNIMDFGIHQLQNAHIYYFNPTNFKYFVESIGLKMVDFGSTYGNHMYGIFKKGKSLINHDHLINSRIEMYKKIKSININNSLNNEKKYGVYKILKRIKNKLVSRIHFK